MNVRCQHNSHVRASTTTWYKISPDPLNLCIHKLVQLLDRMHQRGFCVQWVTVKTETHNRTLCPGSVECQAINGASRLNPISPRDPWGERNRKIIRARGQNRGGRYQWDERPVPSGRDRPCTQEHTVTMVACTNLQRSGQSPSQPA